MRDPQHSTPSPDVDVEPTAWSALLTRCQRKALDQLGIGFRDRRPVAIVVGEGRSTARSVMRHFLSRLDQDVAAVRIVGPCANATDFMHQIIAAVGFEPKNMSLSDLESIFSMFLSFQKAHKRRTVICIEEAQECDCWVLDKIRSLLDAERQERFGLMFVLSGQGNFKELLTRRPLKLIAEYAGKRITLAPFTQPESRDYLRYRLDAEGRADVDEVLEYHAVPLIHELCGGIPDAISELLRQCLVQMDVEGAARVTADLVKRAYAAQRELTGHYVGDDEAETIRTANLHAQPGRLIVQISGQDLREVRLRRGNLLIGRSKLCDIRLDSRIVSRHHALIRYTPQGPILIDLGSTNGTKVDGYPVKEHSLAVGEKITLGDCQIDYLIDDELQRHFEAAEMSMKFEMSS